MTRLTVTPLAPALRRRDFRRRSSSAPDAARSSPRLSRRWIAHAVCVYRPGKPMQDAAHRALGEGAGADRRHAGVRDLRTQEFAHSPELNGRRQYRRERRGAERRQPRHPVPSRRPAVALRHVVPPQSRGLLAVVRARDSAGRRQRRYRVSRMPRAGLRRAIRKTENPRSREPGRGAFDLAFARRRRVSRADRGRTGVAPAVAARTGSPDASGFRPQDALSRFARLAYRGLAGRDRTRR